MDTPGARRYPSAMPLPPAPSSSDEREGRLERAIGPWTLGANAVNLSLGAGIFALPAAVAAILGPAAILAYLVCGLAIVLVLACYVELGSRTTRSGGAIAYIDDVFGPMAGFVAWVVYTLAFCTASDAAVALVFVDALTPAVPVLAAGVPRAAAIVGLFGGLAAVNIVGVRQGARLAVASTIAKAVPMAVLIAAGLGAMRWSELRWTTTPSAAGVGEASLLLFFAFSGAEAALTPSGEIRDPRRTVPRGMLGATAALVLVYVAVQVVCQGVIGAELPAKPAAPLAEAARVVLGPAGWSLMIVGTIVATFGLLAGDLLASPRAFLPVAREGLLPAVVGRVHPRFRTPDVAIAIYAGLGCVLALTGGFKALALLSSSALLAVYFVVCLAVLRARRRAPADDGAFRTPGGALVPVAGMAVSAWLLVHCTWTEGLALMVVAALAAAVFGVRSKTAHGG